MAVREVLPHESVATTESPLRPETLSFGSWEGEDETLKSLKKKLGDVENEKNELNEKFTRLSADFIQKEPYVKALAHHVECWKESSKKLGRESENLWVKKLEITEFPTTRQHPKRMCKAAKLLEEGLEDQLVGIWIQTESMLRSGYVKMVAKMQNFSNSLVAIGRAVPKRWHNVLFWSRVEKRLRHTHHRRSPSLESSILEALQQRNTRLRK